MKKNLAILAAVAVMGSMTAAAPKAHAGFFEDIGKAFNAVGTVLLGPVKPLLDKVHGLVKHGVDTISQSIKKLAGPALQAGKKFFDGVVSKVTSSIRDLGKKGLTFGKGLLTGLQGAVTNALAHGRQLAHAAMSQLTGGKVQNLGGLTTLIGKQFATAFTKAREIVRGQAKHVAGTFRGIFGAVKVDTSKILIGLNKVKAVVVKAAPVKRIDKMVPTLKAAPLKRLDKATPALKAAPIKRIDKATPVLH